jgi:aspartate/methionine/tyrosine aminotransferase
VFSRRTRWDRTPNRLSVLLAARRAAGQPVLDLTLSNPTRAGLPYPADLLDGLADSSGFDYQPDPRGLEAAREAVASDYARRGFPLDPGRLLLTASSSEAYAFLFKLLCDPGDAVLVPHPSYPLFGFLADLESVTLAPYPLRYDGTWHLDLPALAGAITSRARAVVLVNPNNPTGSFLKRDEASALQRLCAERALAIVSDEVFADYALGPDPERVQSLAADGEALAFCLGGLSKSCGLPQLKLGWIAVSGPEPRRREALERLEIVSDSFLSVSTPVQRAAPRLLGRRAELQAPIAERVRSNHEWLAGAVAGSPASLLRVEGGWYAALRVPATLPEETRVCRLLERDGVLVHPGYYFDFPGEAYLVPSLLPEPAGFREGMRRVLGDLLR